jgi:ATP-dependent exoDNAse (exonuclease V) alpha subunit
MNKLEDNEKEYKIRYHYDLEMNAQERLLRLQYTQEQIQTELMYLKGNLRCDEIMKLKVGAQVMCIVNIELDNGDMICNGSQGIVVRIQEQGLPVIRYRNTYEMTMCYHIWASETIPGVGVSQIPLILAWALTIHKAQGSTLEIAEVDAGSGIFECGQTYVALSRVKSLEGLYLSSFDAKRIRINKKVQEFYEALEQQDAKRIAEYIKITDNRTNDNLELLPEAYVEVVEIPVATLVEPVVAELINDTNQII